MVVKLGNYYHSNHCPECNGAILLNYERGETVCEACGLILSEREVDVNHLEKRMYTNDEIAKKSRVGAPISQLLPDMSLTTLIDRRGIRNPDLKRAVKRDNYISWESRNLLIACTELKRISYNLSIPKHVKVSALDLYKRALKEDILRGRSIKGMIAACLYYSCKEKKVPRTFEEFIDESSETPQIIKKCYKKLIKRLKLKPVIQSIENLIPRYARELNIKPEIEKRIIKVIESYSKTSDVFGKNPKGVVAGAIYLVCKIKKQRVSQSKIAETIGITEVTLRSRYKELMDRMNFFIG